MAVAPAHDEAGVLANRSAGEIILAAASRNGGAKFGKRGCTEESVQTADNPDADKEPGIRQHAGNVAGGTDDSGGDGIADGNSDAKPHAQDLQQASAAARFGSCCRVAKQGRRSIRSHGSEKRSRHDIRGSAKCKLVLTEAVKVGSGGALPQSSICPRRTLPEAARSANARV